ncbi:LacI family DNA-binding transcriptional regulator [Streptacidiphilus sp. PAMC 29251]
MYSSARRSWRAACLYFCREVITMASARRPTLETVAMAAGVARGTVSRVINGAPDVAPHLRQAVERAIAAVGYVPHGAARALASGRSSMVAVIVGESTDRLFSDPFYSRVLLGIMDGLAPHGLHQILMMAKTPQERADTERYLAGRSMDGALFLSQHGDDRLPSVLDRAGVPYVLGGKPLSGEVSGTYCVDFDNAVGASMAAGHLVGRGRRRIGTVTGPLDTSVGVARLAGFRDRVQEAGLWDPSLVQEGDFAYEGGRSAMGRMLEAAADIDAVFVANDTMAMGVLDLLRERGVAVPTAVAVVGFDDAQAARHAHPPLTTVRQDDIEMGRRMAALLAARIAGEVNEPQQLLLETELIVRDSS